MKLFDVFSDGTCHIFCSPSKRNNCTTERGLGLTGMNDGNFDVISGRFGTEIAEETPERSPRRLFLP